MKSNGMTKAKERALAETEKLPKVEGWVTRDKFGRLMIHATKPKRVNSIWDSDVDIWSLPDKWFPELTWEDEPKHVELIIREV